MREKILGFLVKLTTLVTLLFLIVPQSAYAYLDPGSGSYILQLLIGALFGGLLAIKIFWRKIKTFFATSLLKGRKKQ